MEKQGTSPLALLETTHLSNPLLIYSPRPLRQSHSGLVSTLHHGSPSSLRIDTSKSTGFKNPSVESPLSPIRSPLGPISTEIDAPCPLSEGVEHTRPLSLPNSNVGSRQRFLHQTPVFLNGIIVPNRRREHHRITSKEGRLSRRSILPRQPSSSKETVDKAPIRSRMPPLIQSVPPPVPASRLVHTARLVPLPLDEYLLVFSFVRSQLSSLDKTYRTHREVFHRLRWLCVTRGPYQIVPVIVICVLETGIAWGYPYNKDIATFLEYFLRKLSNDMKRHGRLAEIQTLLDLIRGTFTLTFNQWCTPPPKVNSASYQFMLRVASFYGFLYSKQALDEEAFLACLKFLSRLTPLDLPIEALLCLFR